MPCGRVPGSPGRRRSSTSPSISQAQRTVRSWAPLESDGRTQCGPSAHGERDAGPRPESLRRHDRGGGPDVVDPVDRPTPWEPAVTRSFADRHIGPDSAALDRILDVVGVRTLDELAGLALPADILDDPAATGLAALPPAASEHEVLAELAALAHSNTVATSMIGLGYYATITPPVLVRSLLENPAWYTAYTPYQPEISQGRLEALLNFQTMVSDLTG